MQNKQHSAVPLLSSFRIGKKLSPKNDNLFLIDFSEFLCCERKKTWKNKVKASMVKSAETKHLAVTSKEA